MLRNLSTVSLDYQEKKKGILQSGNARGKNWRIGMDFPSSGVWLVICLEFEFDAIFGWA